MPGMSLEEVLRSSLEGVNREFQEADKALHAEVTTTSDALSKITNGGVQANISLAVEQENGVVYSFYVQAKAFRIQIGAFRVTVKGFPIIFGQDPDSIARGQNLAEFRDRSQLREFFQNMASNPDSPLVQKTAYLMRKKIG